MGNSDNETKKKKKGGDSDEEEKKLALKVKTYTDVQRFKLEKLMKDPSKQVYIPEKRDEKNVNTAPEFNHNIMGSSAGAGSGEFHLYRQMRRKEQNRMRVLGQRQDRDELNAAYQAKLEENEKMAEERTAKKRKKRMKQKEKQKQKKKGNSKKEDSKSESSEEEESEAEAENPSKSTTSADNTTSQDTSDTNPANDNSEKSKTVEQETKTYEEKKGLTLVFYQ